MSTNIVNKDTGELVTLANGTRMWIGTQSAHDLAVQQGTMPNNCMVCITDDWVSDTELDWANAVAVTVAQLNAGYTPSSNGYLVGYFGNSNSGNCGLGVNGVIVAVSAHSETYNSFGSIQIPLQTTDTAKILNGTLYPSTYNIHFVPYKHA